MKNIQMFVNKHFPIVLTTIGSIGVVGTGVLAAYATPKVIKLLKEEENKKGDELTTAEKIKVAYPMYMPAALTALSSIACIFGANALTEKGNVSLLSAYGILDNSYKRYKDKVKEFYGDDVNHKIEDSIIVEEVDQNNIVYPKGVFSEIRGFDDDTNLCVFYDEFTGKYFKSTIYKVLNAEYHLNRNFAIRGYASVNEFLSFLGISDTDYGDKLGWDMDSGYAWIDFDHRKIELRDPSYSDNFAWVISYSATPTEYLNI